MPCLTVKEIAALLAANPESVCRWLFPAGKVVSGEYCVGSLNGEAGKSLKVRLSGDKAGVWADFAGEASGDLIDLIRDAKSVPLREAIKQAKVFLGIADDPESVVPSKKYAKPPKNPQGVKKITPISEVMKYLTSERKLSEEIVAKFRIGDAGAEIAFPSFDQDGEMVSIKYIGLKRDENGKKAIRQEKGCAPALFGWQALPDGTRQVVITEGQIDAMTWSQFGFPALSVPNGVGDLDGWIDYEWESLQQFDTIYLCFDSDKAGQEAVEKVAKRLGIQRTINVVLKGHKDANEALQSGKGQDYFVEAIAKGRPFKPKQIKSPLDFRDEVMNEFFPPGGEPPGFAPETLKKTLRFAPGQLTIWTGISAHGKSNLLGQVCLEAAVSGSKCAIASMEMPGRKTLMRMVKTSLPQKKEIDAETIDGTLSGLSGKIWIYDLLGNVSLANLMELMTYSVARHGVEHFVIDSLMKLDVDSDDNEAQRLALNSLTSFAMENNVHVHLVCHARKSEDESKAPGKMDVKGAVDIINQCDNLVSVWRNKPKEAKRLANEMDDTQSYSIPDCICYVRKNRETGEEGEIWLWFNPRRNRYLPKDSKNYPVDLDLMPSR